MRKIKRLLFLFICIAVVIVAYEMIRYPIENNAASVQQHLRNWEHKESIDGSAKITLQDFKRVAHSNTYIALFSIPGDKEGMAVLKQGWNKRLRIEVSTKMSNLVDYDDIHTNKGTYALFTGTNRSKQIERVKAALVHDTYTIDAAVPKSDYFVLYEKIPSHIKHPFPATTTLLDKAGDDITVKEFMDQELRE
ncbi:hypothetical protein ABIC37_002664 [Priestia megaterium]|uniref:hypothetical protein n=1 Tax=Priestia megaterium TaxID=1404 RepID=UPI000E2F79DB|nr:hypothetical protein [Priestia megaterium]MCM3020594.1 hypothetical protein [Priestia megaterium]MCM3184135.1 hypothetical protein [Priestia megaterium]MCM3191924.1 hypothetical protein [Priestia megaterium]MED3917435.1 hypothetical protein [Priestia megaterium]